MKIKKNKKTKQEQEPIHISGQSLSVVFHFFPQSLASLSVRRLSQELRGGEMVVMAFSSRARISGECSTPHSPPELFFFFLMGRLARAHLFHSLGQDQPTVAQRAETTVTESSLTSYV